MARSNTRIEFRAEEAPDDAVSLLAKSWREAGRQLPVAASRRRSVICDLPGCSGMSFVEIRTQSGRRGICFKHYEELKLAPVS
jgi:hypothetical protein